MWMWQEVGWHWVGWQGVGLRRNEGSTTPPLLICLAIKGMGWHWVGLAGVEVAGGRIENE